MMTGNKVKYSHEVKYSIKNKRPIWKLITNLKGINIMKNNGYWIKIEKILGQTLNLCIGEVKGKNVKIIDQNDKLNNFIKCTSKFEFKKSRVFYYSIILPR